MVAAVKNPRFNWKQHKQEFYPGCNCFMDSETCGLHGMMVLLQYAIDDGDIHLYEVWKEPVWKTLELIEAMVDSTLICFNSAFDWFHVCKLYTIWRLLPKNWIPEQHINAIAKHEKQAQDGPCLKPRHTLDLLLHSRKGEFQTLMARDDIRIRRVPTALAYALAEKLESEIEIDGIYFAKTKDKDAPRWRVYDVKKHGELDPDFKDVVLKFNPAGGLKFLAEFALGYKPDAHFSDIEVDKKHRPKEYGYAPTADATSTAEENWEYYGPNDKGEIVLQGYAWPGVIHHHIEHWSTNAPARAYAYKDIVYTRELYEYFERPEVDDTDSVLACMVAAVRWHGFKINREGIQQLLDEAKKVVANSPVNINAHMRVRDYLLEKLDDTEAVIIEETTKKEKLEELSKWMIDEDEVCITCLGSGVNLDEPCKRCNGTGELKVGLHPAAVRAKELLEVKFAAKEVELYSKLLLAGKFHASFNVIGTLSSRMSGTDGLNAQGIKKAKAVRKMFPLAWDGFILSGGDFDAFEVTLADAVYDDPELREALLSGKKIHGLFGMALFPGKTYEEILASDGSDYDMYTMAKSGVFAMIYGGNADTLHRNLGIDKDIAEKAYETWGKMFPGIDKARQRIFNAFCTMRQPVEGKQVFWEDPQDYCETFLGFRRYFTLPNKICRALYDLANNVPGDWRKCKVKVVRNAKRGIQLAYGAVGSALFGAAFGIQQSTMRAAANHEIQSPGGEITKNVQRRIWDIQPHGVHEWRVAPMNVHDEIECVCHPDYRDDVAEAVREGVEAYRPKVPLIGMTWNLMMENWAEKKGGSETLRIRSPEVEAMERRRAEEANNLAS